MLSRTTTPSPILPTICEASLRLSTTNNRHHNQTYITLHLNIRHPSPLNHSTEAHQHPAYDYRNSTTNTVSSPHHHVKTKHVSTTNINQTTLRCPFGSDQLLSHCIYHGVPGPNPSLHISKHHENTRRKSDDLASNTQKSIRHFTSRPTIISNRESHITSTNDRKLPSGAMDEARPLFYEEVNKRLFMYRVRCICLFGFPKRCFFFFLFCMGGAYRVGALGMWLLVSFVPRAKSKTKRKSKSENTKIKIRLHSFRCRNW
jgi:hypothetical protein